MTASPLHLRQVCLAVPRLAPVVDDLCAIFDLSVAHRDPHLVAYGLENVLLPVGEDFIELVAPIQPDTAAGRFIARSQGHGGYMAIFQCGDPLARQAAAQALGVRTAHEIDVPGYRSVQLHPRDCRAAFIEFGHSHPSASDAGDANDPARGWWPAGQDWPAHVRTGTARRLRGIVLEGPQPHALLAHWARLLGVPEPVATAALRFNVGAMAIAAAEGPSEVLGAVQIEVADVAATQARAVGRGLWVQGQRFHLAGVHFELIARTA